MKKGYIVVSYDVSIDVEVDENRLNDDEYIDEIREKAREKSKGFIFNASSIIADSDIPELIE